MSYFGIGSDYETEAYDQAEMYGFEDCDYRSYAPSYKTCSHCGESGFLWTKHEGKWRMIKNGKIHACLTEAAKAKKKAAHASHDDLIFVKKAPSIQGDDEQTIDDFVDAMLREAELELMQEHNH